MAHHTDSADRELPDNVDKPDESDESMFTDSFAPRDAGDGENDTLDEAEELLPKGEPAEGGGQLP